MNRTEKVESVDELHQKFQTMTLFVVADYQGFTVDQFTRLRVDLRAANSELHVVKNRLARKAAERTAVEVLGDSFRGPTVIAMTAADPVAVAKVLTKYATKKDEKPLTLRGGLLAGTKLAPQDVEALATLPGLPELRAKFVGLLVAAPRKFLGVLQAPGRDMVGVLHARGQALGEGG